MTAHVLDTEAEAVWLMELLGADETLADLLGGLADPRIYGDLAPPEATYPLLVFQHQSPLDDTGAFPAARVLSRSDWALRCIVDGLSYAPARPVVARADELLHGAAGPVTVEGLDGWVEAVRLSPIRYPTVEAGKQFRHLGGLYRLTVHTEP